MPDAFIKASLLYQERDDKTIYTSDIAQARKYKIEELKRHRMDDIDTIMKVQNDINATIAEYGPQKEAKAKS